MARQHGITSTTKQNIVIDTGAVYLNYGEVSEALLGATRGGNSFAIETEYREMEVDGAKGPLAGMRRITRVDATLTANFLEFSTAILTYGLPGSAAADEPSVTPTHDAITRSIMAIDATDHLTNIAIVGEVAGKTNPIICIVKNPIVDGNMEISLADNDESVLALAFKAHFLDTDLDTEPWEIRYPQS